MTASAARSRSPAASSTARSAFRSLEEEKAALLGLTEARDTAAGFLGAYQAYARIAARRRAAESRTTQSRYDETGRRLGEARTQLEQAQAAETAVASRLAELATEQEQARRAEEVLRASPEMRSAQELHRLQSEASRTAFALVGSVREPSVSPAFLRCTKAIVVGQPGHSGCFAPTVLDMQRLIRAAMLRIA